jgi:glutamyl-tRNA reductase
MGCPLQIGVLGLNHKLGQLELLEKVSLAMGALQENKDFLSSYPIVFLKTCNRGEIYFGGENLSYVRELLVTYLTKQIGESLEHNLYTYFKSDCLFHLAKVTAGLDSAILGETEIQGQVKQAYKKASQNHKLSSAIHFAFQKALWLGKQIRSNYFSKIGCLEKTLREPGNLFHEVIWNLAKMRYVDLSRRSLLLVGFSETNRALHSFLKAKGVRSFTWMTSRFNLIDYPECNVVSYSYSWKEFDWIIAASKREEFAIKGTVSTNLIFDLSVPRIVEPHLATYNIEQIHSLIGKKIKSDPYSLDLCLEFLRKEIRKLTLLYVEKQAYTLSEQLALS